MGILQSRSRFNPKTLKIRSSSIILYERDYFRSLTIELIYKLSNKPLITPVIIPQSDDVMVNIFCKNINHYRILQDKNNIFLNFIIPENIENFLSSLGNNTERQVVVLDDFDLGINYPENKKLLAQLLILRKNLDITLIMVSSNQNFRLMKQIKYIDFVFIKFITNPSKFWYKFKPCSSRIEKTTNDTFPFVDNYYNDLKTTIPRRSSVNWGYTFGTRDNIPHLDEVERPVIQLDNYIEGMDSYEKFLVFYKKCINNNEFLVLDYSNNKILYYR
ncbi:MAG: hypothetical protein JKX76_01620 [Colwellia sp.]|nr:hypothetical protein [Colwellia sp.]